MAHLIFFSLSLTGIVDLWYDHVEYAIITHRRNHRVVKSSDAKAFTMLEIQIAFYILCIGFASSCSVFICELYVHKRKHSEVFEFVH